LNPKISILAAYPSMNLMVRLTSILIFLFGTTCLGQSPKDPIAALQWADSVYNKLDDLQKISQLIVVRLSTIDSKSKKVSFYDSLILTQLRKYAIGGICIFQGGPLQQAELINKLQDSSKVPLLVTVDGEWGLGMRMPDSVSSLPRQMMLGAVRDTHIVYQYARIVADQCNRMGIHMDFAPVVDINNNPANPVINDRSFGENKERVAILGSQYVRGLQDAGVMACVKHFPGHGDVAVDSHYDLPVIKKSMQELDTMELYPFKKICRENVSAVMVGHLNIPAIDTGVSTSSSLSKKNVDGLLRKEIGFGGLCFTDALEMQAVKKFHPSGRAAVEALKAGNDMLLLPEDLDTTVSAILMAIQKGELSWEKIAATCKKVLTYKYLYSVNAAKRINTDNLAADLNQSAPSMKRVVAEQAITLAVAKNKAFFPLHSANEIPDTKLACLLVGSSRENPFVRKLKSTLDPDTYFLNLNENSLTAMDSIRQRLSAYEKIVISLHGISRRPANNFGLSQILASFLQNLSTSHNTMVFHFGNPYAARVFCDASNLAICYEDDSTIHEVAFDMLMGKIPFAGKLPVSICENLPFGYSANTPWEPILTDGFIHEIDSLIYDAIQRKAIPGGVVLAAKNGNIILHKPYGNAGYDYSSPATTESIYDAASLTKIFATTLAIMKLQEEGKIQLRKKISHYLPELKGTPAGKLPVRKLLLHEGGMPATIPFFKDYFDSSGNITDNKMISHDSGNSDLLSIAKGIHVKKEIKGSILKTISKTAVTKPGNYLYSDIDFILLGMIAERITGQSLDTYVENNFYKPMGLSSIGFLPLKRHKAKAVMPTQFDSIFRKQLLHGFVHDPAAAMMGGVAGHAGLFGTAYDFYSIMQMLLQEGSYSGRRYLKPATIKNFTSYGSKVSRRGLGFDKPEKDNMTRQDAYPARQASPLTFGHTGFTGTCAWADPQSGIVYIFLSNRVYPSGSNMLNTLKVRKKVHEVIYRYF